MVPPHDDAPPLGSTEIALSKSRLLAGAEDPASPLPRFPGLRADEARLRARLFACREQGDDEGEASTAEELARRLVARDAELALAVELAERALSLRENPELRADLVGWLSGLGEHLRAAETLRGLVPFDSPRRAARLLTEIGVLLSRSEDQAGALDAFEEAARLDPDDPSPLEQAAMLAIAAPDLVSREMAARFHLRTASTHERAGHEDARLEALFRAFELCPGSFEAAQELATTLRSRQREVAALEVERAHMKALAVGAEQGSSLRRLAQLEPMKKALAAGDLASALEFALDAELDIALEGPLAERFDDLLSRAGLYELFAARLEARAEAAAPPRRARIFADLARLYTGPLASPERAIETWLSALDADPDNEEAVRALRAHAAATRDDSALVEGLLRVAADETAEASARSACLRELAALAEGRFDAPALALFALSRLDSAAAKAAAARMAARLGAEEEALAATRRELEACEGAARVPKLRRLVSLLRGRPDETEALGKVLGELVVLVPEESSFALALERLASRTARRELLAPLIESSAHPGRARALLGHMRAARRHGDAKAALAELAPLLRERKSAPGPCHALVLAGHLGDRGARAEALEALADFVPQELRPKLLIAAAESRRSAGDPAVARQIGEKALDSYPDSPRATMLLAAIDAEARDERGLWTIPRALELGPPRQAHYRALFELSERAGEPRVALLFAKRWQALLPSDLEAFREVARLALETGDLECFEEAISSLLGRPLPLATMAPLAATTIRALHRRDPRSATALARRLLDALGPAEPLRDAISELADEALHALVLERRLAGVSENPGKLLLELSERRRALGDEASAIEVLARAITQGCEVEASLARLPEEPPKESPDAVFAYLEGLAAALVTLSRPASVTSLALRHLAAARWDLAEDREGAVRALMQAALLSGDGERLARDLLSFEEPDFVPDILESIARSAEERHESALALAAAARIAHERGEGERAFLHAEDALTLEARLDEPTLSLFVDIAAKAGTSPRAARLLEAMLPTLVEGEGARTAVLIAKAAVESLDDAKLANLAILRALDLDDDLGDPSPLVPHAPRLAEEAESAIPWIHRLLERAGAQSRTSSPALRFASAVAERLDDPSTFATLLVQTSRPTSPPAAPSPAPAASLAPPPASSSVAPTPFLPAPSLPPLAHSPATWTIPPLVAESSPPPPLPPPSPPPPAASPESDAILLESLRQGSLEAGDRLAERCLAASPPRLRDLVYVRQLQAHFVPGDRARLRQLRDAAIEARDIAHARAVEHVLRAFDSSMNRLPPPALAAQLEQPEAVTKLIFRSPPYLGLEALAVVCEGAPQLFRRDLAAYGYSGAERVPLGSRAPVGRLYTMAARLLGLTRIPLFYARAPKKPTWLVALLAPPAVLLSGEAQEDSAELRYEIGAALASAMPAHALLAALPRERAQTVLMAILASYGPPTQMPRHPAVIAIAETLWQLLPARAERYMRDLCAHIGAAALDYEAVLEQQKTLVRRAGMFVAGDVELAISRYFADERCSPPVDLTTAEGLAAACAAHPTVANLVRLATSPDYAKARWHAGGASPQAPGVSSSNFRPGT